MKLEHVSIDSIDFIEIRGLKPSGVESIVASMRTHGWMDEHPAAGITLPSGRRLGLSGRHRGAAAKQIGMKLIPWLELTDVSTDEARLRYARVTNEAAETVVPTTFVDDAELVWRFLGGQAGWTQQRLAEALGWSREKVKDYAALRKIDAAAWKVVGATFEPAAPNGRGVVAPAVGATAPNHPMAATRHDFTENLLRAIIDLKPEQQLELVSDLAAAKITKTGFKTRADGYAARNRLVDHMRNQLGALGADTLEEALLEVESGAFDQEVAKSGLDGPKVLKLIESFNEAWEKKNSVRLHCGDFFELAPRQVGTASVDFVMTDLPYNLSQDGADISLPGDRRKRDFGDWDEKSHEEFLRLLDDFAQESARVLRPGGSGVAFMSDRYVSFLRQALRDNTLQVLATLFWCKPNTPPMVRQFTYNSATEVAVFFVKPAEVDEHGLPEGALGHTFNWQDHHYMLNYFEHPLLTGTCRERVRDSKGQVLHPTQKPEGVIERFLNVHTNRGDLVLDGFMGVGTVPAVCKRMGRKCIGIERDKAYFEAARRRLGWTEQAQVEPKPVDQPEVPKACDHCKKSPGPLTFVPVHVDAGDSYVGAQYLCDKCHGAWVSRERQMLADRNLCFYCRDPKKRLPYSNKTGYHKACFEAHERAADEQPKAVDLEGQMRLDEEAVA